jgi:hypothetical protein
MSRGRNVDGDFKTEQWLPHLGLWRGWGLIAKYFQLCFGGIGAGYLPSTSAFPCQHHFHKHSIFILTLKVNLNRKQTDEACGPNKAQLFRKPKRMNKDSTLVWGFARLILCFPAIRSDPAIRLTLRKWPRSVTLWRPRTNKNKASEGTNQTALTHV